MPAACYRETIDRDELKAAMVHEFVPEGGQREDGQVRSLLRSIYDAAGVRATVA